MNGLINEKRRYHKLHLGVHILFLGVQKTISQISLPCLWDILSAMLSKLAIASSSVEKLEADESVS